MTTTLDFIEYVCDQINDVGVVRHKKMFGEYMVYVNDKPILLVCDNTVYAKILPCLDELLSDADKGYPYNGAKKHYILDTDNTESPDHHFKWWYENPAPIRGFFDTCNA